MKKYILAIDQGTTSSRAIIFDEKGQEVTSFAEEFEQYFPDNGWVEHDPNDILETVLSTCEMALKQAELSANEITGIGITNQRETTILWDKETGEPVYNAIVWQDRRTADFCNELRDQGKEALIQEKTGLLLDPYFSASKISWILDHVDGARARAEKEEILFGTVETFLLWHLTKGQSHYTDVTNASRTSLLNIRTQKWDDALLKLFNVPVNILPEVRENLSDFGVAENSIFGAEIPIVAMAGDQHAASFGQCCFEEGMVKSTYGTGAFVLKNTGDKIVQSKNKLLTTIAWKIQGKISYALEGSVFVAGSAIQFLRDGLNLIEHASESEALAQSIKDNGGVYFVPALTGLGAPYWNAEARGVISGLTRGATKAHIVRACLEAQAYQTKDLLKAMYEDTGIALKGVRVDGGVIKNDWVCQFISDMLDLTVDRPANTETTALGIALMAGLSLNFFKDLEEIKSLWKIDQSFYTMMKEEERSSLYDAWKKTIERSLI